ncbi:hypothetical protein FB565_007637 [Actinoplanes lutulentus]|uniref:GH26 domain-containing protein n=1 Tax=Actinoplanes lutulentus TaxID=1287878 RepID=A0A327Z3L9_9ACTN|nr:hypothetical protein [Actinoplanes lutulentus]MBB2947866.1 hypothetical protein [Actinoplanes lutulentus]RAK29821.1 hypothetical protein B0I29_117147 [Actinoplanes lutulentus]
MKRLAMLSALTLIALPLPAHAAGTDTAFGVISSTQGPSEPDTWQNFVRLYDIQRERYQSPIGIRLFSGGRLPLPGEPSMVGRLLDWAIRKHPEEIITISHRVRDDARLRQFLDVVKDRGIRVSVIYFHEAQAAWFKHRDRAAEPSAYQAAYRKYRDIIDRHPAHAQVTLEKNLMWYWQRFNTSEFPTSDWRRYVGTNDPADLLSWDTYTFPGVPPRIESYSTPDEFFRYARDAWREFRMQWGVGEIGSTVQDGTDADRAWDPDGKKFTSWVRTIAAAAANPQTIDGSYAGMPPAKFVKWWCARDAKDIELGLEQVPSAVDLYRPLIQAYPLK